MNKFTKRILMMALAVTMTVGLSISASAANPMSVELTNGKTVTFSDVTGILTGDSISSMGEVYENITIYYLPADATATTESGNATGSVYERNSDGEWIGVGATNYTFLLGNEEFNFILSVDNYTYLGWDFYMSDDAVVLEAATEEVVVEEIVVEETVADEEVVEDTADVSTATPTSSTVLVDGEEVAFDAYNIADNNYFKLRDLGEALGFNVSWDALAGAIVVASDVAYTAD